MNERYTKDDIRKIVEEEGVEFIRLQFVDIFGALKNIAITRSNLEKALDNSFEFDGTYVNGYDIDGISDMILYPDLNSFEIFPWRPMDGKVGRLICDVYTTDGHPLSYAPRQILWNVLQRAKDQGVLCNVGPECEFFLFPMDDEGNPLFENVEDMGYLDLGQSDVGENVRRDMVLCLEDLNFDIESSYHEKAPGQHEIDFKYRDALRAADDIVTLKLAVKAISSRHGMIASFMPKPMDGIIGSGMHVNVSLEKYGRNIFYSDDDDNSLSKTGYHFIAGVLDHLKGMSLITNPSVNSYRRLAGKKYVPNTIAFSMNGSTKTTAIRIPHIKGQSHARIEVKNPDPLCNPYLTIALILAAGMDGIEKKRSVDKYRYGQGDGFERLPVNLGEAISSFSEDSFVKEVLGKHITDAFIEQKTKEWEEYLSKVSDWEIEKYLAV